MWGIYIPTKFHSLNLEMSFGRESVYMWILSKQILDKIICLYCIEFTESELGRVTSRNKELVGSLPPPPHTHTHLQATRLCSSLRSDKSSVMAFSLSDRHYIDKHQCNGTFHLYTNLLGKRTALYNLKATRVTHQWLSGMTAYASRPGKSSSLLATTPIKTRRSTAYYSLCLIFLAMKQ